MNQEELKEHIIKSFPEAEVSENKQFLMMTIGADKMLLVAEQLKKNPEFLFDYLFCVTGTDHPDHLMVTYHLRSTKTGASLVLKVKTADREKPAVHTVSHLWPTADFHEREIKEMFGIDFTRHPDPRNLLLPDDWEGFPMRKDYSDPINIVDLE